ncbi:MAG: YtxH domain-containing protein [Caldisericia bacterium]|jgi:gas vesicle protein|nr:YtxH domain-containing protein [Caldisericia bacterium]MDD5690061.1 YtxH domain-containing protein [Caldisericia bacterium]HOW02450.1 YtxH domain-containing protein [Caldisericia bacterium]HPO28731.1 YtxH domain-containing protein [Caldisericia bacterium]HXK70824.1 YtxH domain-containing protein [Caldisericia bacterium]
MEKEGSKFLVGLTLGLLFGGIAALLLAPQSGEETRKKLTDTGEKLKEAINNLSNKLKKDTIEFGERKKETEEES